MSLFATTARARTAFSDWEDAVRTSVALLEELGVATPEYADACVQSLHVNGPYIVLMPGLALAHARPEQGATGLGVSLIRVDEPVAFGHPANDPVDLVFAFATPDPGGHITMLQILAKALAGGLADRLRAADPTDLDGLLEELSSDDH